MEIQYRQDVYTPTAHLSACSVDWIPEKPLVWCVHENNPQVSEMLQWCTTYSLTLLVFYFVMRCLVVRMS